MLDTADVRPRYIENLLEKLPVKSDEFAYQRDGVNSRVANAIAFNRTGDRLDALHPEKPSRAQHVIAVADQDDARQTPIIQHALAEYSVFFRAAASLFHKDGIGWQARRQQDLAAGSRFRARIIFGLSTGAQNQRRDALLPEVGRMSGSTRESRSGPSIFSQARAQNDYDFGRFGCVLQAGEMRRGYEDEKVEQGSEKSECQKTFQAPARFGLRGWSRLHIISFKRDSANGQRVEIHLNMKFVDGTAPTVML